MTTTIPAQITNALSNLPKSILERSGSVFYSGRMAFSSPSPLYVLGLNPGGCPLRQSGETVAADIDQFWTQPDEWSAYADESWEGKQPGTHGMQPRMLHMFKHLGLNPRHVPSSNLVFVRSREEAELAAEKHALIDMCWPVHAAVIQSLGIQSIVCLGGTTGNWVRTQMGAHEQIDEFVEDNARGWRSVAHRAESGYRVLTLTHPGRVDWRNPAADPSPMARRWI